MVLLSNTMTKLITRSFKVDLEAWKNFLEAAKSYGATPSQLLRELVTHVDAAVKGVQSGRIKNFDGDVARLITTEFGNISSFQLQMMAEVLTKATKLKMDAEKEAHEGSGSQKVTKKDSRRSSKHVRKEE